LTQQKVLHAGTRCVQTYRVDDNEQGIRLDHFLVNHLPDRSRSGLGKSIRSGHILVNSQTVKPGYRLRAGDVLRVSFPPPQTGRLLPEPVPFDVLHQDDHLIVISKPPGVVVHPAAGHDRGTLVNGLLHRFGALPGTDQFRPGIVHRLDKDTSGIMIVARTETVLRQLSDMFKNREISKRYHALLLRHPKEREGRIVAPIGRHVVNRKKMAVQSTSGRYAATCWQVVQSFNNGMCLAQIAIETGRTHQIRVHMASLGAPVAGDRLYGGRVHAELSLPIRRQMLHSSSLDFIHPATGQKCSFTAPVWPDMQEVLNRLVVRQES
jgi:23S rRNA pseudouridine1911/1915/1917 synthase